jgi:hypothetical protein
MSQEREWTTPTLAEVEYTEELRRLYRCEVMQEAALNPRIARRLACASAEAAGFFLSGNTPTSDRHHNGTFLSFLTLAKGARRP